MTCDTLNTDRHPSLYTTRTVYLFFHLYWHTAVFCDSEHTGLLFWPETPAATTLSNFWCYERLLLLQVWHNHQWM